MWRLAAIVFDLEYFDVAHQPTHVDSIGRTAIGYFDRYEDYKGAIDDEISYTIKEAEKRVAPPVDFDIEILYEDAYLLVVNKPSGLVVHPAPSVKEATLVDWLIHKVIYLYTIFG